MKLVVDSFFHAVQSLQDFDQALDILAETIGAMNVCTLTVCKFPSHKREAHFSDFSRRGRGLELADYVRQLGTKTHNEDSAGLHSLPLQTLLSEHQLLGLPEETSLPTTEFRRLLNSLGIDYQFVAVLNEDGPFRDVIFFHLRSDMIEDFKHNREQIEALLPVVSKALELRRIHVQLSAQFSGVMSMLDSLGLGVFLVNEKTEVLASNIEAEHIIALEDGLKKDRVGRLRSRTDTETALFKKTLQDALRSTGANRRGASPLFPFSRKSRRFDFLASIHPVSTTENDSSTTTPRALVVVIDPEQSQISTGGLSLLGHLTDAERDVASLLVSGRKVSEISKDRNVSQDTVRFQLKSITAKLNCSSQSDIIRLAASTNLPLERGPLRTLGPF